MIRQGKSTDLAKEGRFAGIEAADKEGKRRYSTPYLLYQRILKDMENDKYANLKIQKKFKDAVDLGIAIEARSL